MKIFSETEIAIGIRKLERQIDKVEALNPHEIAENDALRETVENSIRDSVREVFDADSQEAHDFARPELYHSDGTIGYWDDDDSDDWQSYARGIPQMVTRLRGLIAKLEDKRIDLGESPDARAFQLIEGLSLHSAIADACLKLFRDGHYAQSVFEASKALIELVKQKSGRADLDGVGLMTEVFSVKNPVLRFNDMASKSDEDIQKGMMHLFMGAVEMIRNPRGHSFMADTAEEALELIGLLNLLAKRLETSKTLT